MKKLVLLTMVFILVISSAYAHIPYYSADETIVEIKGDPEISRAYYGWLDNNSAIYIIDSQENFELYVNILAPYRNQTPNLNYKVYTTNTTLYQSENIIWTYFYEEFGRDEYWRGSEFVQNVSAGKYYISVYGEGKYALATGREEKWGVFAIMRTLVNLPIIKFKIFRP